MNEGMSRLLEEIASDAPTPGGGSASALAGALAAALAGMVWRLTSQKAPGDDAAPSSVEAAGSGAPGRVDLERLVTEADGLRRELSAGFGRDAGAYDNVLAAFRLPKTSDTEKAARREAIEAAMQYATEVPLENARLCLRALKLAERAVAAGYQPSVTDSGVGVLLARAGLVGCLYNVELNLVSVKDSAFAGRVRDEAAELWAAAREAAAGADRAVLERIEA
jgi:methenyltetrahydrofolate cyclohydrolase